MLPKFALGLIFISLTTAIFLFYIYTSSPKKEEIEEDAKKITFQLPQATPFPFEDLTISYLKNREYKNNLSALEKYDESSSYKTYLTSYNSDGLKINGLLTIPNGEKPGGGWPAIVFVHGYIAPTVYKTTGNYVSYVDFLSRNGFVVFKIDLRGHDKSEGEPSGAYYSSDYVIDTLNAYAALQSADFVNPKKIGLWGHSMAGNVVFRSLAVKGEIPAAVILAGAVYTYLDFAEFGISDNSYRPPGQSSQRTRRRDELFKTYGQPKDGNPFWQKVAATNYLDSIKGAIQMHHAINDDVVDISYSKNLIKILDKTTIPHELYEYQNGGHNLDGISFNQAMQRTVDFFKKYL